MKRYHALVVILVLQIYRGAAQDFPTFGKVTSEEFKMKECPFDKEAPAVVLIDEAESIYNEEHNLITERHIRLKILKEKSINYVIFSIPYYRKGDFEFISNMEGIVINIDANNNPAMQVLEKKFIYNATVSDRIGEVSQAFPSVKEGITRSEL